VAKPVQIRASYRDDAAFLLRLEAAVAKDDRQTDKWRKDTCGMLRNLSQILLAAKVEDHTVAGPPKKVATAR
jgi:hypothetical protein